MTFFTRSIVSCQPLVVAFSVITLTHVLFVVFLSISVYNLCEICTASEAVSAYYANVVLCSAYTLEHICIQKVKLINTGC